MKHKNKNNGTFFEEIPEDKSEPDKKYTKKWKKTAKYKETFTYF